MRVTLDEYAIMPQDISVPAGRVRVRREQRRPPHPQPPRRGSPRTGTGSRSAAADTAQPGDTVRMAVDLKPGTYLLRCSLANHDDLGMAASWSCAETPLERLDRPQPRGSTRRARRASSRPSRAAGSRRRPSAARSSGSSRTAAASSSPRRSSTCSADTIRSCSAKKPTATGSSGVEPVQAVRRDRSQPRRARRRPRPAPTATAWPARTSAQNARDSAHLPPRARRRRGRPRR